MSDHATPDEPRPKRVSPPAGSGVRDSYGLNRRQRKFVKEILKGQTATAAYADAYECKDLATAASNGSRLLKTDRVRKAIDYATSQRASPESVVANFERRANYDPADAFDLAGPYKRSIHDIPPETRKAIKKVEQLEKWEGTGEDRVYVGEIIKVEFYDRLPAVENLAKYQSLTGFKQMAATGGATFNGPVTVVAGQIPIDPSLLEDSSREVLLTELRTDVLRKQGQAIPRAVQFSAGLSAERQAEIEAFRSKVAGWSAAPLLDTSAAEDVEV